VADLFKSIDEAYQAAMVKLATPKLTRVLNVAVERQAPPRSGLMRPKMRYAHQGGMNPPIIVIHGNALDAIPASYTRYLEHTFRKVFKLQGTPLRVQYKTSENPFDTEESKEKSRAKPKPMSKLRGREKEVRWGKSGKK
jgi:GTP-binding protein